MAAGYSAIANGGMLRRPRLITQVGSEPTESDSDGQRVISSETSAQLRRMLEGVLEPGGTASAVSVPGYVLAGKTGTAQKVEDGELLRHSLRRLVRRLRPGPEPEAAGCRDGRRAALCSHRRRGGGARIRRDRRVRAPLPGDLAPIEHSSRGPHLESPAMRLEDLLRDSASPPKSRRYERGDLRSRLRQPPCRARHALLLRPRAEPRRARVRRRGGRGGRRRARGRAAAGPGRARGPGRRRARGDGAAGGAPSGATRPRS